MFFFSLNKHLKFSRRKVGAKIPSVTQQIQAGTVFKWKEKNIRRWISPPPVSSLTRLPAYELADISENLSADSLV